MNKFQKTVLDSFQIFLCINLIFKFYICELITKATIYWLEP
jgi:hypothetical protein